MSNAKRHTLHAAVPWALAFVAVLLAVAPAARGPGGRETFDLAAFGRLPVSADGRVKPFDTVARNTLLAVSGRQTFTHAGEHFSATRFLLDLIARPEVAQQYDVIRIDHPQALGLIGREPDDVGRYSLADVQPHFDRVAEQAEAALQVDSRGRDPYQRAVVELYSRVDLLLGTSRMYRPYSVPPLAAGEEWRPFAEVLVANMHAGAAKPDGGIDADRLHPGVASLTAIMSAYNAGDASRFNQAVAGHAAMVRQHLPAQTRRAGHEVLFNRLQPFYGAMSVYVLAFLLGCVSLLLKLREVSSTGWGEALRRGAFWVLLVALAVHTLGLVARVWLQGRPPVTNLYSSAVFVGWAAVLMGVGLERIFKLGLGALAAAVTGFATLVVAHNLGNDGDTMQMMQAVLDSNFWLATHVVAITLGYSAMFLAGVLGIAYIALGVFTRTLDADRGRALSRMVYGITCFALLFSFVGTVLGGIWADQSWGRFWGWDPKENGAALVVLMSALVLHARWGGLIRGRGIAVLAVAGNIVTAWSWFGTNMLGVGLHSYGFMDSAVFWLMAFVVSQLAVMSLGLLPLGWWRSHRQSGEAALPPAAATA